jgi:hypothetical protein
MSIQPSQPQTIGGVLDTTFQLYKASVVKMIPLSLLMVIAGSPQSIYMFMRGASAGGNPADPLAMLAMMQGGGYWLAACVGIIGSMWMLSAAYLKIHALGTGGDLGIGTAVAQALTRLPAVILMVILFGIALTIGLILLLIPGLILMVSLGLCFAAALFDGKGPIDALTESHRLVWGNWWRTFAILSVGVVIIFVIYMIAALIIGLIVPVLVFGGGAGAENVLLISLISGLLIGVLMSLLLTPFYISLAVAIYWDLKLRKDGGDLAARVGALNPA